MKTDYGIELKKNSWSCIGLIRLTLFQLTWSINPHQIANITVKHSFFFFSIQKNSNASMSTMCPLFLSFAESVQKCWLRTWTLLNLFIALATDDFSDRMKYHSFRVSFLIIWTPRNWATPRWFRLIACTKVDLFLQAKKSWRWVVR